MLLSRPKSFSIWRVFRYGSSAKFDVGSLRMNYGVAGHQFTECNIDNDMFSPNKVSFGDLTKIEMIRSIMVLKICSIPGFADNASRVLRIGKACLGQLLFTKLMRATAYSQFVAGDSIEEIKTAAERLDKSGVSQMLAVPIEAPEDDSQTNTDELLQLNVKKAIECVNVARDSRLNEKYSLMQIKLTAIICFDTMVAMSKFFCDSACNFDGIVDWIKHGCDVDELKIIAPKLDRSSAERFSCGVARLVGIITHAEQANVQVLIDAEHTWINPAIQQLGLALMAIFNKKLPVVYLTYQAYLKETQERIRLHAEVCQRRDVKFALKLVRGAYVVVETSRVGTHPPYMCDNWDKTNENYDQCLQDLLLMNPKQTRIVVATHNENSIRLAVELLLRRGQPRGVCQNVSFAQLYGMSDYISFTLGSLGYDVYKSVPYGTVDETLPYLARRVKENCLFLRGARKDLSMLKSGLWMKLRKLKL